MEKEHGWIADPRPARALLGRPSFPRFNPAWAFTQIADPRLLNSGPKRSNLQMFQRLTNPFE
jgi:hypothetical protein